MNKKNKFINNSNKREIFTNQFTKNLYKNKIINKVKANRNKINLKVINI
jgi:hypothetical protein